MVNKRLSDRDNVFAIPLRMSWNIFNSVKILLIIIIVLLPSLGHSQKLNVIYSKTFGGHNSEITMGEEGIVEPDYGKSIVADSLGNSYVSGSFKGNMAVGKDSLVSRGGSDIFVTKMDSNGSFIWSKAFGGVGDDFCTKIQIDAAGNIYLSGLYKRSISFPNYEIKCKGEQDVFILSMNTDGQFKWAKSYGTENMTGQFSGLSIDASNNILLSANYTGNVNVFKNNFSANNWSNFYVLKLDSNGDCIWAKSFGGPNNEEVVGLKTDNNDNIILWGCFDQGDMMIGNKVLKHEKGIPNKFILMLSKNGNITFMKAVTGLGWINDISCDSKESLFLIGSFHGSPMAFGNRILKKKSSLLSSAIFITKMDYQGNFIWTKSFEGTGSGYGKAGRVNRNGTLLVCGEISGNVFLEKIADKNKSILNGYIAQIDQYGKLIKVETFKNIHKNSVNDIFLLKENIYIAGSTMGPFTMYKKKLECRGVSDVLILKAKYE